jgi:hypothetical protein
MGSKQIRPMAELLEPPMRGQSDSTDSKPLKYRQVHDACQLAYQELKQHSGPGRLTGRRRRRDSKENEVSGACCPEFGADDLWRDRGKD